MPIGVARDLIAGMKEAAAFMRGEVSLPVRLVNSYEHGSYPNTSGHSHECPMDGEGNCPQAKA